jgi:hypothetical protein
MIGTGFKDRDMEGMMDIHDAETVQGDGAVQRVRGWRAL